MGYFSIRVMYKNGEPAKDIKVMINYGLLTGIDEKRTDSEGWVEFHNWADKTGDIYVDGDKMGDEHSLSDGRTYSFTI